MKIFLKGDYIHLWANNKVFAIYKEICNQGQACYNKIGFWIGDDKQSNVAKLHLQTRTILMLCVNS
jgi:hypothetical protein